MNKAKAHYLTYRFEKMKIDNDDELRVDALILKKFENLIIIKNSIAKNLTLND